MTMIKILLGIIILNKFYILYINIKLFNKYLKFLYLILFKILIIIYKTNISPSLYKIKIMKNKIDKS